MSNSSRRFYSTNKSQTPSIYGFIDSITENSIVLEQVTFGTSQFVTLDNVINANSNEFYVNSYVRVTKDDSGNYKLFDGYQNKIMAAKNLAYDRINIRSFPYGVPNNIYNLAFIGTDTGFNDAIGGNKNLDKHKFINLPSECKKIIRLDASSIVKALQEIEAIQNKYNLHILIIAVGGKESAPGFNNLRVIYQFNKIKGVVKYVAIGHSDSNYARIETQFSTDTSNKTPSDIGHLLIKHLSEVESKTSSNANDATNNVLPKVIATPQPTYNTPVKKSTTTNKSNGQIKYIAAIIFIVAMVIFLIPKSTNSDSSNTSAQETQNTANTIYPSPTPHKSKTKVKKKKPKKKQSTSTSTSTTSSDSSMSELNNTSSEGI